MTLVDDLRMAADARVVAADNDDWPAATFKQAADRIEVLERELADYKRAVADELHFNMQAILDGTPEHRMKTALTRSEARCKRLEKELRAVADCPSPSCEDCRRNALAALAPDGGDNG